MDHWAELGKRYEREERQARPRRLRLALVAFAAGLAVGIAWQAVVGDG